MTMEEIDRRRDVLENARDERKNWDAALENGQNSWRDVDEQTFAWARERDAEAAVLAALREWWAHDCQVVPDPEAGCPCGKVAVKPGEDPLVKWCEAGHPTDEEGRIEIPS
jgi:hypothetical protein